MQVNGRSPAISGFELPPSLRSASMASAFVESMVIPRAIFPAAAAAVPPVPVVRATGGTRDVQPLLAAWAWTRLAVGLGFHRE